MKVLVFGFSIAHNMLMGNKSNIENREIIKGTENKVQYATASFDCNETKAFGDVAGDDVENFFYFDGYGSAFDVKDSHDDVTEKGCFAESLKSRTPMLLWAHNTSEPLGVFLEAREDNRGLYMRGKMPREDVFVSGRVIPQIKVG